MWGGGLWGGEMNSEAVSMVTRPRFWVAPVGGLHLWVAPLFLGGGPLEGFSG